LTARALVSVSPGTAPSARAAIDAAAISMRLPTRCVVTSGTPGTASPVGGAPPAFAQRAPGRQPPPLGTEQARARSAAAVAVSASNAARAGLGSGGGARFGSTRHNRSIGHSGR